MRQFLYLLLFLSLPLTASAVENTAAYYIPPAEFNAALEVMDSGYANVFALLRNATGSFTFDDTTKAISNLKFAIDSTSLLAGSNENQRDLSNLLGSFKYSEIRITAPDSVTFADNKAEIKANIFMHGVSKPVTLEATLNKSGTTDKTNSMWSSEGKAIGLSLRAPLKRTDFGITDDPSQPARFGDTITLMLEVQAIKQ